MAIQSTWFRMTPEILIEYRTDQYRMLNGRTSDDEQPRRFYIVETLNGEIVYVEDLRYTDETKREWYKNQALYQKFPAKSAVNFYHVDLANASLSDQTRYKTSELVKVGVDAAGNPITSRKETSTIEDGTKETWEGPLQGAVFGLFTDAAGTTPLKDKEDNDVTATTGEDGRMTFTGLDAGIYYLKEISAPDGYVTNSDVYKVEITAETEEVTVTETVEGKEVTYKTDVLKSYKVEITDPDGNKTTAANYTFTNETEEATNNDIQWTVMECEEHPFPFTNVKGTELPSTGGIGTTIFYLVGTILVLGAGILLVTRRRMKAR